MIAEDKFGRPIFDYIFNKLVRTGHYLTNHGYTEANYKPNLFYHKINNVIFFADMRGTSDVPIWSAPIPLFYWIDEEDEKNRFLSNRIILEELNYLHLLRIEFRFAYEDMERAHYMDSDDIQVGICKECGKDFNDNGFYCSPKCKNEYLTKQRILKEIDNKERNIKNLKDLKEMSEKIICSICKRHPKYSLIKDLEEDYSSINLIKDLESFVNHHTDYVNDITILMCKQCHSKIHQDVNGKFKSLKPPGYIKPKKQKIINEEKIIIEEKIILPKKLIQGQKIISQYF